MLIYPKPKQLIYLIFRLWRRNFWVRQLVSSADFARSSYWERIKKITLKRFTLERILMIWNHMENQQLVTFSKERKLTKWRKFLGLLWIWRPKIWIKGHHKDKWKDSWSWEHSVWTKCCFVMDLLLRKAYLKEIRRKGMQVGTLDLEDMKKAHWPRN